MSYPTTLRWEAPTVPFVAVSCEKCSILVLRPLSIIVTIWPVPLIPAFQSFQPFAVTFVYAPLFWRTIGSVAGFVAEARRLG